MYVLNNNVCLLYTTLQGNNAALNVCCFSHPHKYQLQGEPGTKYKEQAQAKPTEIIQQLLFAAFL